MQFPGYNCHVVYVCLALAIGLASCSNPTLLAPTPLSLSATPLISATEPARPPTTAASPTPAITSTPTLTPVPTLPPTPLLSVRVLTYNVRYGGFATGENLGGTRARFTRNRITEITEILRQSKADIIGIQEASNWSEGSPSLAQKIANELGMEFFLAAPELDEPQFYTAIFTKYKIVETETLTHLVGTNSVLRARLMTPDGEPLNVFVVHLPPRSTYDHRLCETERLMPLLLPYREERSLVMGDFNFNTFSKEAALLDQAGWQIAGALGIDQVRVAPGTHWTGSELFAFDADLVRNASDHNPVGLQIDFYAPNESPLPTLAPPTPTLVVPAPEILTSYLVDPQVTQVETFDRDKDCYVDLWRLSDFSNVENGQVLLIENDKSNGLFDRVARQSGTGVLMRVKFSEDARAALALNIRSAEDERFFGISLKDLAFAPGVLQVDKRGISGNLQTPFRPVADAWYNVLLAVGKDGRCLALVWNPADPSQILTQSTNLPRSLVNQSWLARIFVSQGKLWLDEIQIVSFTEIR